MHNLSRRALKGSGYGARERRLLTFETGLLRDVERRMRPADSILSIASAWSCHLMESCNAVALLELDDIRADGMDDSGNIVALI